MNLYPSFQLHHLLLENDVDDAIGYMDQSAVHQQNILGAQHANLCHPIQWNSWQWLNLVFNQLSLVHFGTMEFRNSCSPHTRRSNNCQISWI